MSFEIEHAKWIKGHLKRRNGERKDALKRGHGFGNQMFVEQIWWSLLGHYDGLHPESIRHQLLIEYPSQMRVVQNVCKKDPPLSCQY